LKIKFNFIDLKQLRIEGLNLKLKKKLQGIEKNKQNTLDDMCNAYTSMWGKLLPSSNACGFLWWRNIDVHGYVGRHVGSSYR